MSERRVKILRLMRSQTRVKAGQLSGRLAAIKDQEYQEFDLADRVRQMRDHARLGATSIGHGGDLTWATFVGKTLTEQLCASHERSAELQRERAALEAELSKVMTREKSLRNTQEEALRSVKSIRAELEERRDTPPAPRPPGSR
ncbi:MAG: hypothetical protein AAGA15_00415 [Pseudomonadota bacterium]